MHGTIYGTQQVPAVAHPPIGVANYLPARICGHIYGMSKVRAGLQPTIVPTNYPPALLQKPGTHSGYLAACLQPGL